MNMLKMLLILFVIGIGGFEWHGLATLISPVAKCPVQPDGSDILRKSLVRLGCPRQKILSVATGIQIASDRTGISPVLLSSLLFTESNFRKEAISPKGYKGLMQTPIATMIYPEVDILHGAMILKEKLYLANGNWELALTLYKGGRNPVARKQAREVIRVYNNLIRRSQEVV